MTGRTEEATVLSNDVMSTTSPSLSTTSKPFIVLPPSFKMTSEMRELISKWGVISVDGTKTFDAISKGQFEDSITREKRRNYNSRPDVMSKKKEYFNREEVKERRKEYSKRPEVIERKKELNIRKNAIIRKLRSEHPLLYLNLANKSDA